MRVIISLACGECKRRNYSTMKNKKMILIDLNGRSIVASVGSILLIKKLNKRKTALSYIVLFCRFRMPL